MRVYVLPAAILMCGIMFLAAAENEFFTYSGNLSHEGQPSNGTYDFRFVLRSSPDDSSAIGGASTNFAVAVTNGQFIATVDARGWNFGRHRWLEIGVRSNGAEAGFSTLSPLQPLKASPHAMFAATAAQAQTANSLTQGGAELTVIPAGNLVGAVPLSALTGISSNQIDAATDAVYRMDRGQQGFITPYDCGAIGDGVTDDTAALQRWIDYACVSNLVAFLPPARGSYYRFTDTLYIRDSIKLIGAGGGKHATSWPMTRCMLKQFTPGKHGLKIVNPSDSVHLESFAISALPAGNWSNDCYGVWFAGGAADSDCSIMQQVLVMNFGVGVMAASQADTSFRQTSLGYNGTGIVISGVANNIALDSCQLSYNVVRQVQINPGSKVTIQNSDIAAGADGTKSAQGIYCSPGQELIMIGSRFEDYTTNACLIAGSGSRITLLSTQFLNFSGAVRYSLMITNAHVVSINSAFSCLGPRGVPILDHSYGKSSVLAFPPVQEWLTIGRAGYYNTASTFTSGRGDWTGSGPGPGGVGRPGWAYPGSLEWGAGTGPSGLDNSLWAYGRMAEAGYTGVQAVDLLAFAKQQRAGLHGNGLNLTNLHGTNIISGTIGPEQLHPEVAAAYRNQNAITNNYTAPVTLGAGLTLLGNLQVVGGSLVVQTNAGPGGTTPKAWFEVRTSDGQVWKIGLHQ